MSSTLLLAITCGALPRIEASGYILTRETKLGKTRRLIPNRIAAGAYFTLFLARPNESLSEVTRWPEEVESDPACYVCGQAGDKNGDPVLECERCEAGCHKECCDPPLAVRLARLLVCTLKVAEKLRS